MNLDQFKNWAISAGSVGKYTDGQFVGECVSLINQYLARHFNIQAGAWGNAKDWASNPNVLNYFDKVGNIQPGDIIVYGSNFGGGYGHIAVALGNGQMVDQNGVGNGRTAVRNVWPGYIAVLRRKGAPAQGDDMATITNEGDVRNIFKRELGRLPDDGAIKNFTGIDYRNAADSVADSDEYKGAQRLLVASFYKAFLGRNASSEELDIWASKPWRESLEGISTSPEAKSYAEQQGKPSGEVTPQQALSALEKFVKDKS